MRSRKSLRAEAAKHDIVGHAHARAGEHCNRQLRNHPHVDGRAVALLQSQGFQNIREAADLTVNI